MSPKPKRKRQRRNVRIRALVQHADSGEVTAGFGPASAAAPRLVAAGNRFDGAIPGDTSQPVTNDAAAYFAAASVLHLEDGYSYAGRSIGALLRGDRGAATHLAYYAELRAAMSLLAAHGVLNLNTVVFSLGSGTALMRDQPGGGTHQLAWLLLDEWAQRTEALDLLSDTLRPFNVPLRDWLNAASIPELAASPQATARHWLRTWSLDLKRMEADHAARNRFSYNPTRLITRPAFASEPFISQLWQLLEPTPGNPFETFDRHLLRLIVEHVIANTVTQAGELTTAGVTSPLAPDAATALANFIASARTFAGAGGWETFLSRVAPFDHDSALITFSTTADDNPWSLLSRALILLRVAAGAVRDQMSRAGVIGSAQMDNWAQSVIDERSLIDIAIDDLGDLWVDIEVALEHLAGCPPMDDYTQHMLRQLETSERIALWALAA